MGKRCGLTAAERREVVLAFLRHEEPAALLARRHGISETTLHKWRSAFVEGGEAALANGHGDATPQARRVVELERDLTERDRVIGELTIANRVLKKIRDGSI